MPMSSIGEIIVRCTETKTYTKAARSTRHSVQLYLSQKLAIMELMHETSLILLFLLICC